MHSSGERLGGRGVGWRWACGRMPGDVALIGSELYALMHLFGKARPRDRTFARLMRPKADRET